MVFFHVFFLTNRVLGHQIKLEMLASEEVTFTSDFPQSLADSKGGSKKMWEGNPFLSNWYSEVTSSGLPKLGDKQMLFFDVPKS